MNKKPKIIIYDTTLRDGTQGEGISFSVSSKLRLTKSMDQFGVDYIEGGWPGSNPRDMEYFEAVKDIKLKHAKISSFGSTRRADFSVKKDPQLDLLLKSETEVVAIFGKSWLLHVKQILRTTPEENLRMIEESIEYIKNKNKEVIYDAEHFYDGYKDNTAYALKTLEVAIQGGADYLVLCDTNGGNLTEYIYETTKDIIEQFPNIKVGVHCHNDIGLGVATSLAGINAGALMVQGTLNGYGERNGNANLTSIIPNLILKMEHPMNCGKNLKKLRDLSLFVDDLANLRSDTKAPYVGASSFAHKGGIHANAASKDSRSYEHIEPSLVGNRQRVLVSDLSGRSSIMMKIQEMGLELDKNTIDVKSFLKELKDLEYRGYEYEASDASFRLLFQYWLKKIKHPFELISYRVIVERDETENKLISEATVKIKIKNEIHHVVAESHGPVGALDRALRQALEKDFPEIKDISLSDFKVRILDSAEGTDARIRVQIESSDSKEIWGTVGASDNIIEASWEALKDSVEYKILRDKK